MVSLTMLITAKVTNTFNHHRLDVETKGESKFITIAPRADGYGSAVNGGELLLAALATCFCNDLYREARKRNITINSLAVECSAEFAKEGEGGRKFRYSASINSPSNQEELSALIEHTDKVAEIHNTLRNGVEVELIKEIK